MIWIIVGVLFVFLVRCIRIVPQASEWVIEFLGQYHSTWSAGIHFKIPLVMRIAKKVSLKEQVADFEPQPVITKDNVTMQVDSIVFFQMFDSKLFTYGVERPIAAIENLSATTLRNIIGAMTLDETLTSRDTINDQITQILDAATDKWGIKVNRVEVKNIMPPNSIREAMEKQMRAEREKREQILTAEGEKQSAITRAEGEKEAAILKADAVKERRIREAEGEAEAILVVQRARAESIDLINKAAPGAQYLQLEQYEAAKAMADGNATKIIVPTDMANLVSGLSIAVESIKPTVSQQNENGNRESKPATSQRRPIVGPAMQSSERHVIPGQSRQVSPRNMHTDK